MNSSPNSKFKYQPKHIHKRWPLQVFQPIRSVKCQRKWPNGTKFEMMDPTVSTGPNELVTNSNVETGSIEIVYHEILIQNIKSGLRRCSIQFTIKNRSIANDQNSNFPTNSCSNSTTKWKFQSKSFQRFNEKSQPNGIEGKINFEPKVKEIRNRKWRRRDQRRGKMDGLFHFPLRFCFLFGNISIIASSFSFSFSWEINYEDAHVETPNQIWISEFFPPPLLSRISILHPLKEIIIKKKIAIMNQKQIGANSGHVTAPTDSNWIRKAWNWHQFRSIKTVEILKTFLNLKLAPITVTWPHQPHDRGLITWSSSQVFCSFKFQTANDQEFGIGAEFDHVISSATWPTFNHVIKIESNQFFEISNCQRLRIWN